MKPDRVALLIDADNVSIDVVEQAVVWVAKHCGGPHVRRAYCTAESAVKHQGAFKRLSIRPMVNLAAGKNSTDIALAVDAIDLAASERPDVVVIASSDSDFAPLVARLREKGCRVVGLGQKGKVGEETAGIYDDFEVLVHRGASAESGTDVAKPARSRKTVAKKTAAKAPAAAKKTAAAKTSAKKAAAAEKPAAEKPPAKKTAVKKSPAKTAAKKTAAKKAVMHDGAPADDEIERVMTVDARPDDGPDFAVRPRRERAAETAHDDETVPERALAILRALPELARGGEMPLNQAAERLRQHKVLSKSGSSAKLFAQFPQLFGLEPANGQPHRVVARRSVAI